MALEWVPRGDDNEWNINCQYLKQDGANIGAVWYSIQDYYEGTAERYKKSQWYYTSMLGDAEALEANNEEEAKALCIMLCKLNQ